MNLGSSRAVRERVRGEAQVWRTSEPLRTLAMLALYPMSFIVTLVSVTVGREAHDVTGVLVFTTYAVLATAWGSAAAFRRRVVVDDARLTVVGTFTTVEYPREAVASVESEGLSSLKLVLSDGSTRRCGAIQATNLMLMLERRTRVDQVAEEVVEALGGPDRDVSTEPFTVRRSWTGLPAHAWTLIGVYVAMATQWFLTA
ncbi:PH domain-containing protein [Demequina salsinemoris]|uniref:PH domain-containing protein n=1 Tax=Demequina salsinemoris TaxID=577470 RepID=UPI000783B4E4|nr:PH domain-containing protein [Demequina salsinemoris]